MSESSSATTLPTLPMTDAPPIATAGAKADEKEVVDGEVEGEKNPPPKLDEEPKPPITLDSDQNAEKVEGKAGGDEDIQEDVAELLAGELTFLPTETEAPPLFSLFPFISFFKTFICQ
jgi:hypothetical protein